MAPIKKITRYSLTDQIFDYLQGEILKGTWKPGDKLPSENELSTMLGVSRLSLRSAIQRSCALGLTETRVGEGTFVCEFNLRSYFAELYRLDLLGSDPNQINDLRNIIQIGSVRLALADEVDPSQVKELDQQVAKMEQAVKAREFDLFYELDLQFHRKICMLCKNQPLYIIYDALESTISEIIKNNVEHSLHYDAGCRTLLDYHRKLVDAVRARDMEAFSKTILESRNRSHQYYKENDPLISKKRLDNSSRKR